MGSHTNLFVSRLALALVLAALAAPAPGAWAKSLLVKRNTVGEERGALEASVKKDLGDESPDVAGGERDGLRSDDLTSDYPTTVMPDAKLDGSRHDDDETTLAPAPAHRSSMDEPESRGDESALATEAPKTAEADDDGLSRGDEAELTAEADRASKTGLDDEEGSRGDSPSDDSRGDEDAMTTEKPEGSRGEDVEASESSRSGADEASEDIKPEKGPISMEDYKKGSRGDDSEMTTTAKPEEESRSGADFGDMEESRLASRSLRGDETALSTEAPEGSRGDEDELTSAKPERVALPEKGKESEGSRDSNDSLLDDVVSINAAKPDKDSKKSKHPPPHPRPYFTSPTPSASTTKKPSGSGDSDGAEPKTTKKPAKTKQPPLKRSQSTPKPTGKPSGKASTTKKPPKAKPTSASPKKSSGGANSSPKPSGSGLGLDPNNLMPLQQGDQVLVLVKSKAGKIEARLPHVA